MTSVRSRQGCRECRKRRRKCDEVKPSCGHCDASNRRCEYELRLVWSGRKPQTQPIARDRSKNASVPDALHGQDGSGPPIAIPDSLPNGMALPTRYKKLLEYFAKGVLASLSSHPSVHDDLCQGLMPAMLHSPHLLSASLALSAAGLLSRGLSQVEGVSILRVMEHLQSSGLSLLRHALAQNQKDEILVATCLLWCLADVFAGQKGIYSWRIHLQGIKALLQGHQPYRRFTTNTATQAAMRHLFQLYRSLETLPQLPTLQIPDPSTFLDSTASPGNNLALTPRAKIDGFLGYSEELLDVLQQISVAPRYDPSSHSALIAQADILLGKLNAMISRDSKAPPDVSISSTLSPQSDRDYLLCHRTFQQATLIQLYRQLYNMPSSSQPIQSAVQAISGMVSNMTQGQPCNTWVAMAMPLFTVGCEAFNDDQKSFILDKVDKLEECLGSLHVQIIKQALKDIWQIREDCQDFDGGLCASQLILFVSFFDLRKASKGTGL